MIVYLTIMFVSMILFHQVQVIRDSDNLLTGGQQATRVVFMLVILALLGCTVSWRDWVGTDYGNYIDIYILSENVPYAELLQRREPLFGALNRFCADLFDDYLAVFVVSGFLTVGLLLLGIYKNSASCWLSVFLFIAGMYYFDLFNGMRQMISAAIMFAAYPLLQRKKWLPIVILALIAQYIHASSYIVLLVFLYAAYVPPKSLPTVGLAVFFLAIVVAYGSFADVLIDILTASESVYTSYNNSLMAANQGANVLRFGLAATPVVISVCVWSVLLRQRSDIKILWTISYINALFMLLATRHWIFSRFSMFFGMYNILLWPEIIKCFNKKSRLIAAYVVVIVYFVYFWLIVHVDSELLPYKSLLFEGVYE